MDDLIGRLVASIGVDRTAAEKAVGTILQFLLKAGRPDVAEALSRSALRATQQGKTQSARSSARSPASASSSDA